MVVLQSLLLIVVSVFAPLIWLMYFGDLSLAKQKEKMEKLSVDHARTMQEIQNSTSRLIPEIENDFIITYLVPAKDQPWWVQLLNKIRIYPYTYTYGFSLTGNVDRLETSKYTKTISKSKWFYMQLKNWTETHDREAAIEAMQHLDWERDIP